MPKVQLVLQHDNPALVESAISASADLFAARKARKARRSMDIAGLRENVVAAQMEKTILRAVAEDEDNIVEYGDD